MAERAVAGSYGGLKLVTKGAKIARKGRWKVSELRCR